MTIVIVWYEKTNRMVKTISNVKEILEGVYYLVEVYDEGFFCYDFNAYLLSMVWLYP
jgi:hypothetical protein